MTVKPEYSEFGYCERCDIIFGVVEDEISNFNCLCGNTHLMPCTKPENTDHVEILHEGGPCDRRS